MSLLQRSLICLQTFPATCLPKERCRSPRKATVTPRQAVISSLCLPPMDIYTKALMVMTLCCICLQFQLTLLSLIFSVPFSPLTWGNILNVRYSLKTFGCMQNRVEIDWSLNREENQLAERRNASPVKGLAYTAKAPKPKYYYEKEML